MLIKQADDKTKRLRLLEELQASPMLDSRQKDWLKDEYWRVKRGIEGETDAAFYIDSLLRDGQNHAVIHDLRLIVDGDVAQIDHLVFNRMLDFILVETKCYRGHLQINEAGEFTVRYDSGKRFGVPSPLAQSERHARVLAKLLERIEIAGRLGTQPKFHHVVMLHPKAIIERPDAKRFDTSNVIKADQFAQWRERWLDKGSALDAFAGLLNVRGKDTLQDWAEKLARQHQPADLLTLPDFMQPRANEPLPARTVPTARQEPADASGSGGSASIQEPPKRLICATCQTKISYAEGKFCWNNVKRFGGLQYCREHQQALP
jgi:hypothetical protein